MVVYVDAQYSHDGSKGVGIVIVDTHDNTRHITGGTIPTYLLSWIDRFASNSQQRINQCELLSVVVAVLSFPELFQDRDVLLWIDSTAVLKTCIDGYSRAPEMEALGSGLHLLLADLQARVLYQHVPGKANPADIPSSSPFILEAGAWKPDPNSLSLKEKPPPSHPPPAPPSWVGQEGMRGGKNERNKGEALAHFPISHMRPQGRTS